VIYIATWADGRQLVVRAPDEDQARMRSKRWREEDDPMYDGDVSAAPSHLRAVNSRGPVGALLAGWNPAADRELQENP
jgi:hypothetical protein